MRLNLHRMSQHEEVDPLRKTVKGENRAPCRVDPTSSRVVVNGQGGELLGTVACKSFTGDHSRQEFCPVDLHAPRMKATYSHHLRLFTPCNLLKKTAGIARFVVRVAEQKYSAHSKER